MRGAAQGSFHGNAVFAEPCFCVRARWQHHRCGFVCNGAPDSLRDIAHLSFFGHGLETLKVSLNKGTVGFGDFHTHPSDRIFSKRRCLCATRQHQPGTNSEFLRFQCEAFGKGIQRGLTGGVDRQSGKWAQGDAGTDIDDDAGPPFAHRGHHGAGHCHSA